VVWAASAVFAGVYGWLAIDLHNAHATQTFDLGIYDQGLWLLSRFESPFITLRGLHLFGDHASFVMIPMAPLFWIWDDTRALILFTVAALAVGAPLLFAIGRRLSVAAPLAAAVAVAYLLYPALNWMPWWGFHPEMVAVPLLIAAFLFALKDRPWWCVAACLAVLLVKEDAPLVVVPLAAWLWLTGSISRRAAAVIAAAGVAVLAFDLLVALPHFSPTGELIYVGRYGRFGDTLPSALVGMVVDPTETIRVLLQDRSLVYVAQLVVPLAVALRRPSFLLVAVPVTVANILSSQLGQSDIRFHYSAYATAIVAVAAVLGAARLRPVWPPASRSAVAVVAPLLVVGTAVVTNVAWSPSPMGDHYSEWFSSDANDALIADFIEVVPDDAVVSADSFLAPHFAHRRQVYRFPTPFFADAWGAEGEPPLPDPSIVEWVAVRPSAAPPDEPDGQRLTALRASGDFDVVVDHPELVLLQRRD
jgi:uncharacterized membrane protein